MIVNVLIHLITIFNDFAYAHFMVIGVVFISEFSNSELGKFIYCEIRNLLPLTILNDSGVFLFRTEIF